MSDARTSYYDDAGLYLLWARGNRAARVVPVQLRRDREQKEAVQGGASDSLRRMLDVYRQRGSERDRRLLHAPDPPERHGVRETRPWNVLWVIFFESFPASFSQVSFFCD